MAREHAVLVVLVVLEVVEVAEAVRVQAAARRQSTAAVATLPKQKVEAAKVVAAR
jgi:hypothetical protein